MVWSEFGNPDALGEFEKFASEVQKERPGIPLVFNYSSSLNWGRSKNRVSFSQLSDMGYKVILVSMGCVHAAMHAVWDFMADLKGNAEEAQFRLEDTVRGHPTEDPPRNGQHRPLREANAGLRSIAVRLAWGR